MSIRIDRGLCVRCGACRDICPGSLIELDDTAARLDRPGECWNCASCVKECPVSAIALELEPALGSGESLRARRRPDGFEWIYTGVGGGETRLVTLHRAANRY